MTNEFDEVLRRDMRNTKIAVAVSITISLGVALFSILIYLS